METMHETSLLSEVLGDLSYPAEKWQITTCAQIYGADIHTRRSLYHLPSRTYADAADVTAAIESTEDTAAVEETGARR
jgi:Protein of unknown function (DUF2795)